MHRTIAVALFAGGCCCADFTEGFNQGFREEMERQQREREGLPEPVVAPEPHVPPGSTDCIADVGADARARAQQEDGLNVDVSQIRRAHADVDGNGAADTLVYLDQYCGTGTCMIFAYSSAGGCDAFLGVYVEEENGTYTRQ